MGEPAPPPPTARISKHRPTHSRLCLKRLNERHSVTLNSKWNYIINTLHPHSQPFDANISCDKI